MEKRFVGEMVAVATNPVRTTFPIRLDPVRLDPVHGAGLQTPPRQVTRAYALAGSAPSTWSRPDQLAISAQALTLSRLSRMWGALGWLFGQPGSSGPAGWTDDLSGLRQALAEIQQQAETARLRGAVLDTLKSSVLRESEKLVDKYFGLKADGGPLRLVLEDDMEPGVLAYVSYTYDSRGRAVNPSMHLNMAELTPDTGPNGINGHTIENDRIIAHELTHAIMGRMLDMRSLPTWFIEGTAEYIAGGAERLASNLNRRGAAAVLGAPLGPWQSDSLHYAGGYLAVRYLDHATAAGGGIKAVMAQLKGGASLDQAIAAVSGGAYRDTADFLTAFAREGEGLAFLRSLDLTGRDAGSVKAGAGPLVVDDRKAASSQPMQGFRVVWPSPVEGLFSPYPVRT